VQTVVKYSVNHVDTFQHVVKADLLPQRHFGPPSSPPTSPRPRALPPTKGYRREDAKEKKSTMDTYWVPGVNHDGRYGRWAFAEFTDVYQIEADFADKVESEFQKMIDAHV
jgi:hypothetical protein